MDPAVLEHLHDPESELGEVYKNLKAAVQARDAEATVENIFSAFSKLAQRAYEHLDADHMKASLRKHLEEALVKRKASDKDDNLML